MYLVTHECIIAIVKEEKLYLFLIVGMLETVHSVDTATLGGLGGIPLYVFSTATSFKESLFFLLRFEPFIIKNMLYNYIFNCRHVRDCTSCGYCYLWWSWWYSSLCLLYSYFQKITDLR